MKDHYKQYSHGTLVHSTEPLKSTTVEDHVASQEGAVTHTNVEGDPIRPGNGRGNGRGFHADVDHVVDGVAYDSDGNVVEGYEEREWDSRVSYVKDGIAYDEDGEIVERDDRPDPTIDTPAPDLGLNVEHGKEPMPPVREAEIDRDESNGEGLNGEHKVASDLTHEFNPVADELNGDGEKEGEGDLDGLTEKDGVYYDKDGNVVG